MGEVSAAQASTPIGAVFLSYASQDAEAAQKICGALRAAGVEVFFDQSELRGGDVWDERIRREIHDCALFIPVISANTAARHEGYFRLEWDLADQRSHMMARSRVFVVPVCLDATTEAAADVPESFRRAQWTRLAAGETPPAFVARVRRLLSPEPPAAIRSPANTMSAATAGVSEPDRASRRAKPLVLAILAIGVCAALAYLVANKFWVSKKPTLAAPAPAAAAAFNPPPHSIAVLPFVNMSGDKEQDYFSDGLSEELLNSLARISELQVAARTSSFYFKGEHADLATIAHKLNVASVLEGSVRRSGQTVRVTAQLNNAVSGFHLWSQTYDRDLSDVLRLQTEIADAVASALKITLLGGAAEKVQLGGTGNPAAFDAYLRGVRLARIQLSQQEGIAAPECRAPLEAFSEAIKFDPNYALAYARRSLARWDCASTSPDWLRQPAVAKSAREDAQRAIELAPGLADGYVALSNLEVGLANFAAGDRACTHALTLAPSDVVVLNYCSWLAVAFGRADAGIAFARRSVVADPLSTLSYRALGDALYYSRRYGEATAAYQSAIDLDPEHASHFYYLRGRSYYSAGNLPEARASCEVKPEYWYSWVCQAIVYRKLGRREPASAALKRAMDQGADAGGYQYAEIYAQWGDTKSALDWVEKAMRLRDTGLSGLRVDPFMDPLRKEPRFQAVLRELKFPD
ncbi:MAG: TIR domain-containing protein [Gammaproteobacteria bacterium]|nr:TIR domain-containing protein [Gammaproteobacteria bacterium]